MDALNNIFGPGGVLGRGGMLESRMSAAGRAVQQPGYIPVSQGSCGGGGGGPTINISGGAYVGAVEDILRLNPNARINISGGLSNGGPRIQTPRVQPQPVGGEWGGVQWGGGGIEAPVQPVQPPIIYQPPAIAGEGGGGGFFGGNKPFVGDRDPILDDDDGEPIIRADPTNGDGPPVQYVRQQSGDNRGYLGLPGGNSRYRGRHSYEMGGYRFYF